MNVHISAHVIFVLIGVILQGFVLISDLFGVPLPNAPAWQAAAFLAIWLSLLV